MLVDEPLRNFLDALSSASPTPGGGSAAAAAAAMGASLLEMIASLPKTRNGGEADRAAMAAAVAALRAIRGQLSGAIDADPAAYDAVVSAYKYPRANSTESSARLAAIERALKGATDVPLGVMRLSQSALKQAHGIAAHVYRPAASDARVGVALLRAALNGARWNIESNIAAIVDPPYVDAVRAECQRLADEGEDAANEADRLLQAG